MAVKQTAGRTQLGEFAPKFAELNDDVLFGEVWSREEQLSLRDRSLVTVRTGSKRFARNSPVMIPRINPVKIAAVICFLYHE